MFLPPITLESLQNPRTVLSLGAILFAILFIRYLVVAGPFYVFFWKLFPVHFQHRRIQENFPPPERVRNEFLYSTMTLLIFTAVGVAAVFFSAAGMTQRYAHIEDRGWPYFFFSIALMIVVHDAYFYWTHRFMHLRGVFKYFHRVHHESSNPSPWAAFSFHPLEAIVEASIIFIVVFTIPHHPLAIFIWLLFMTVMNVLGHLGYELFPRGFTRGFGGKIMNTSVHHNMHHRRIHCNYGLYFNWWDRWFGTNHADYHATYDAVTERKRVAVKDALAPEQASPVR